MCKRTREPISDFDGCAVAQLAQRAHAAAVERREFDAEFAASPALAAPRDATLDHDFSSALFEAAHQRRAVVGQIGGAQMHAARAHVDRFGFEGRNSGLISAHFDQGLDPHATCALGATFLNFGHGCLRAVSAEHWRESRVHPE
jgi:hypothetical protein